MRMPSARGRSFHDRAEFRLQRLFAEVFDFACGDESVGHGFLLRLWAATIAALMTKTSSAFGGDATEGRNASAKERQLDAPDEQMQVKG